MGTWILQQRLFRAANPIPRSSTLQCVHRSADGICGRITMPELRQNFFTKEWVIIATERAKRPEDLATHRPPQTVPSFVETCPFCPGNESKTPAEIMRYPANTNEPWAVRVIPTSYLISSRRSPATSSPREACATCGGASK